MNELVNWLSSLKGVEKYNTYNTQIYSIGTTLSLTLWSFNNLEVRIYFITRSFNGSYGVSYCCNGIYDSRQVEMTFENLESLKTFLLKSFNN